MSTVWMAVGAACALAAAGAAVGLRRASRRDADRGRPDEPGSPGTLGRYRLVRELGRGSMGVVYLGHDPKNDRTVALKTLALRREFGADDHAAARARFFREAEAAGRLRHPDIVAVFEAGEADGLAFIAMAFAPGDTLLAHTRPGALLPVATVVSTVARVALALSHAHAQGVVHRDIKPSNVMFDAATGSVQVTDFGIATLGDGWRTRTGELLGTPHFMSPEQLLGQRVDGRSDLYSLGVVLFQLLTGELPHRAESMGTLLQQIAQASAPDVRSVRPDLPEAIAEVVARALQKSPQARHANGRQLADALHRAAGSASPAAGDNFAAPGGGDC